MKKILLIALVTLFSFSSTFAIDGFKVVFNQTGAAVDVQVKIVELSTGTELYAGPTNNYTPNASGIISVNVPAIPGIDPVNITNSTYVRVLVNTTIHSQRKLNEMIFEQAQAQAAASEPIGDVTVSDGGELKFAEPAADGNNYTAFKSPALAGNVIYTLPVDDGDANQVLTTDGSGILSWTTPSGGGGGGSGGGEVTTGTTIALTPIPTSYTSSGAEITVEANTTYIVRGFYQEDDGAGNSGQFDGRLQPIGGATITYAHFTLFGVQEIINTTTIEFTGKGATNDGLDPELIHGIIRTGNAGSIQLQFRESSGSPNQVDLDAGGKLSLIKLGGSSSGGGGGSSTAEPVLTREDVLVTSGANNDIDTDGKSFIRITGFTGGAGAFTLRSLTGGVDGKMITVYNLTGQNMTTSFDSGSPASDGILNTSGGTANTIGNGHLQLIYDGAQSRWNIVYFKN